LRLGYSIVGVAFLFLILGLASPSTTAFSTDQSASVVLGQSNFMANTAVTNSTGMNGAAGVAINSTGPAWVTDQTNNRVLEFTRGQGYTNHEAASVVLGQQDFTQSAPGATAIGLNTPEGILVDHSGNVWVADWGNNRVLEFVKGGGFTDGQPAAVVLGQPDFIHNAPATTATGMNGPNGVALDKSGNLWVADSGNNRVLEFMPPFTNGEAASLVLGQPDFVSNTAATTSTGMNGPNSIALDQPGNLWVADFGNNRVLEFQVPASATSLSCNPVSFSSGSASLCTAKVTGNAPTGTVKLSQTGGSGSVTFPSGSTCSLSTGGSCSVTVMGSAEGSVNLQATYGGDSDNAASSGTTSVNVLALKTTTTTTSTTASSSSTVVSTTSSSTSVTSTSTKTTNSATSSTASAAPSTSASTSTSASGGGGIPEFPYQLLTATVFTVLLITFYLVVRPRRTF